MRFAASFVGHAADAALAASTAARAAERAQAALEATGWPAGVHVTLEGWAPAVPADAPLTLPFDAPAAVRLTGRIVTDDPALRQPTIDTVVAVLHDAAHDVTAPVDLDLLLHPETEGGS